MLRDEVALLAMPGAHHKALLRQAHALHQGHMNDADELGDLLELADAALAYAVESLLDIEAGSHARTGHTYAITRRRAGS